MEPKEVLPTKEIVTTINLIQTRLLHNFKKESKAHKYWLNIQAV